jgi:hypothetical protein
LSFTNAALALAVTTSGCYSCSNVAAALASVGDLEAAQRCFAEAGDVRVYAVAELEARATHVHSARLCAGRFAANFAARDQLSSRCVKLFAELVTSSAASSFTATRQRES